MVVPGGVVAEGGFVDLAAVALVRHVGDPDAADAEAVGLGAGVQVGP